MEQRTEAKTESKIEIDEYNKQNLEVVFPHVDEISEFPSTESMEEYAGKGVEGRPYKHKKYVALYKARMILSQIGNMQERVQSKRLLKMMKQKGLDSV